ncbi:MAG: hypothetical protein GY774_07720 [Planctomycetes bacterium]|nr:hypothetical protein [Planctomycetota bacterium]
MAAWFNRKTAKAMGKMAESLRAETRARAEAEEKLKAELETKAAMERKVKAEAEKMLLAQFNKYNVMVERAEAKAKEAMGKAEVQIKEAEEKILSYELALDRTEENLKEANKRFRAETLGRIKAEEMLKSELDERKKAEEILKSELEEREKVEAQVEEAIAASNAKAEEKVQSYEAARNKAQEKLIKPKVKVKKKAIAKAKESPKAGIKERQRYLEQPEKGVFTLGGNRRNFFHLGNIKRKFILLLVLIIFSALTFALSIANDPPETETDDIKIQGKIPEQAAMVLSDSDNEQLNSEAAADKSLESSDGPALSMTNAPSLNYESSDNITLKADEEKSAAVPDTQLLTITANPEPLKITASANGKNNIVQFSDDNRLETRAGSNIYYEFSDVSIPSNAVIRSVVLFVEHFEEERFTEGKLEWAIGTGWPGRPAIWATMKAPVHDGESSESVDAWDITSVADTAEKINSVQLQIRNNNNTANGKTLVDYAYVVIEYR